MSEIITINFSFLEKVYYFLARYRMINDVKEYYITIMDGSLERMLYGNHVLKERNGFLELEIFENNDQEKLKTNFAVALSEFINIPITRMYNLPIKKIVRSMPPVSNYHSQLTLITPSV